MRRCSSLKRWGEKAPALCPTELISSYLFSFVAGKFQRETRQINGRQMTMLHRESDREKVARNLDAIFDLHGAALSWLEEYTALTTPFRNLILLYSQLSVRRHGACRGDSVSCGQPVIECATQSDPAAEQSKSDCP